MSVDFKFELGQQVIITDAKFKARVVGAMFDDAGRSYKVMFWHEASQRVEVLRESELEAA